MADDADAANRALTGALAQEDEDIGGIAGPKDVESAKDVAGQQDSLTESIPGIRLAVVIGVVVVAALGGLAGWLGYRADQSTHAKQERALFLQVGRQGALNLTTIDYTRVDADIRRVLDSSTGAFHEDFQKRSPAFAEVVKKAQSKSVGVLNEAGLESATDDSAQVLVAVSVKTSNVGADDQQPRNWRMRVGVQKVGDAAKVSSVGFVP